MEVRVVDPRDDDVLAQYQQMAYRAEMHERPWENMWSLEEVRSRFQHKSSSHWMELYCAFDDGRVVGGGFAEFPLLDNTDKVYAHVSVEPDLHRRGIGTAVVEHLVARCRQEGRSAVIGGTSYPFDQREDHPYRLFAEKNGFALANTEVIRVLRLPVPRQTLLAMAAECAPHHDGYHIETHVDELPDRLVESYCSLQNQLVLDAPQGDLDFEEEAVTPEVYLEEVARMRSAGRQRYTTVALDRDGVVVAHTDLVLPGQEVHKILQWGTLVRRDHRGHRLGAAVKVANLLAVQDAHPERTMVSTSNAEVNASMVGINDRLGFEAVAVCPMFQRRL